MSSDSRVETVRKSGMAPARSREGATSPGSTRSVATMIAEYLVAHNVNRVFGLVGGHIQPLWDATSRAGIDVVAVRHEASAVYMAHAYAQLTGRLGVAIVTAGPGLTNAITGIANASVSRVPVLLLSGRPPRAQLGMAAMQDIPQDAIVAPVCRRVETITQRRHVLPFLDRCIEAALGAHGISGPAYVDVPWDLLEEPEHPVDASDLWLRPRPFPWQTVPEDELHQADTIITRARRLVVIGGRAACTARSELIDFLDQTSALYLDTTESRGAVPPTHPAYVPALRSRLMREADVVVTMGRRLDFQLGYGSPAVFAANPAFIRIGSTPDETRENRPGDVELRSDVQSVLRELIQRRTRPSDPDTAWLDEMRAHNATRSAELRRSLDDVPSGGDGRMHPYTMIAAINRFINDETIVVADGGDVLSFARVALTTPTYLDCGSFGCLGVGVPFAVAASISFPSRRVVALLGDGSLGFNAFELETAARRGTQTVFVIANNGAWNIDRIDQLTRWQGNVVGVEFGDVRHDLVAKGLGLHAERVTDPMALDAALTRAFANTPALVDVIVTRDAVSPDYAAGLGECPQLQALSAWNDAELARYGDF